VVDGRTCGRAICPRRRPHRDWSRHSEHRTPRPAVQHSRDATPPSDLRYPSDCSTVNTRATAIEHKLGASLDLTDTPNTATVGHGKCQGCFCDEVHVVAAVRCIMQLHERVIAAKQNRAVAGQDDRRILVEHVVDAHTHAEVRAQRRLNTNLPNPYARDYKRVSGVVTHDVVSRFCRRVERPEPG
jgi:hypothetical protein